MHVQKSHSQTLPNTQKVKKKLNVCVCLWEVWIEQETPWKSWTIPWESVMPVWPIIGMNHVSGGNGCHTTAHGNLQDDFSLFTTLPFQVVCIDTSSQLCRNLYRRWGGTMTGCVENLLRFWRSFPGPRQHSLPHRPYHSSCSSPYIASPSNLMHV